jgi:hypothetical protein
MLVVLLECSLMTSSLLFQGLNYKAKLFHEACQWMHPCSRRALSLQGCPTPILVIVDDVKAIYRSKLYVTTSVNTERMRFILDSCYTIDTSEANSILFYD